MMAGYEKPILEVSNGFAEGVYLASGGPDTTTTTTAAEGCDSQYMKGVWQAPDYSDWAGNVRSYKAQFGCLGCPANTDNGCGLLSHYVDSGFASSYDVDDGNRMPSWERKGYDPNDAVSDWNM
jgi:hypothetical protein